jgi:histidine triad (HIT) family protein
LKILKSYPKTFIGIVFVVGLCIGQLKPIDWMYWKIAENEIPKIKRKSLIEQSPFLLIPKDQWILESKLAFVVDCDEKEAPLHFLIIPKQRFQNITEVDEQTLKEMFQLMNETVEKYAFKDKGFRIVINTNPLGAQTVYHLHIHILSGRQLRWPPG